MIEPMVWVQVDDTIESGLPRHGQAVLVRRAIDNWHAFHTVQNGKALQIWRWATAVFTRGVTFAEGMARGSFQEEDEFANNLKPYAWKTFGGQTLHGQDVTHWAPISDPSEEGDG